MPETAPYLPKLDIKDRKILRELDMDARMPIKRLAKKVGVSRQVAEYRVRRLVKVGIISGFLTIFDSATVGKRWFRVVIQLRKMADGEKQAFISYFKKQQNVLWLGEVGGNWDFVINFVTDDQFSFDRLLNGILREWGATIRRCEVLLYINVRDQQRRYVLPGYGEDRRSMRHDMKHDPACRLDDLDKSIIGTISRNASLDFSKISSSLKAGYKTIQNRMKALENRKVILGYRSMLDPSKLGYETYMIFISTSIYRPEFEKELDEFLDHPNVTFVVRQLGRWRIGMEVEFRNRDEFQEFLVELRARFGDNISEYETFPIFHDHMIDYFPKGALEEKEGK